ncbi:unnamed protein product [Ilex paraguariensis]|uniref:TORTIFOLIA1/SINE1-2 N-terminal domain-containing protein n=1 Tax=Ilex paraguariensis TaxID=185542 RepID=A0ABC8R2D3_9AQUA
MALSKADLKQKVITCLNKLSDRDTLAVATTELEFIARNLTTESFSAFLNCISTTDSSEKSPVRRQCVRLLSLLSAAHGDSLSPHVSKMISAVLRRLRDPDSAVRSACVESVTSMASHITKPPFSAFSNPLVQDILIEQDYNVQIGASMCLSAAIEASHDPEPAELKKLLPKLLKLVRSDCFKAKPALLYLIGSIASSGGASSKNVSSSLVSCSVEFLSSEDWAARKAAAEILARLALAEKDLLAEFKASCVASLESRRFDKVKVVRESMNRALELWKDVAVVSDEASPQSQSNSSSKDCGNSGYPPTVSKGFCDMGIETPQQKKTIITSRTPPSEAASTQKRSPPKSSQKKPNAPMFSNTDINKPSDWKIDIALPQASSSKVACEDDLRSKHLGFPPSADGDSSGYSKRQTKRSLFNQTCDEKLHKLGSLKFGSRVVPFHENDYCELDMTDGNNTEEVYGNQKEIEDLSLIRKQLLQIEHQQSSLLDLLQRFIGSSQSGMNYLETRVNGLEKALDEMSQDLAISTGRISKGSAGNTCCMLPGAEFLSPKFWKRTEAQYSISRSSFCGRTQSLTATHSMPHKDANAEMFKLDSPRDQQQSRGQSVANPMGDRRTNLRETLKAFSNRTPTKIDPDAERIRGGNAGVLDGASLAKCMQQQT